ncbi:hypothetical protein [Aporhodopirellula aestuarii]|uniref:Uncharacterized protein n=1 Tax=Aporhodopirellula aestuarii TaxID=2950107 RepID=A0ABT0U5Y7_9BACT|nr:hypothetical protein [Aporhodopirellula aestuarii]MCM2372318.1 hypothetical protein [Aporhodopirellula aestuarii]
MTGTDDSLFLDDTAPLSDDEKTDANDGHDETHFGHWYDGLPEALGVLSAIVFPLTTAALLHMTIESFERRDILWLLFLGFPVSPVVILSFIGMKLGFRSYPRAKVALVIVQIPSCLIAFFFLRWLVAS